MIAHVLLCATALVIVFLDCVRDSSTGLVKWASPAAGMVAAGLLMAPLAWHAQATSGLILADAGALMAAVFLSRPKQRKCEMFIKR